MMLMAAMLRLVSLRLNRVAVIVMCVDFHASGSGESNLYPWGVSCPVP